jgi:hypothetical protein
MHTLALSVEVIGPDEVKETDGIKFTSCAFVRIKIDGVDFLSKPEFEGSSVCFAELERSLIASGRYLVFTCVCGIAADAGWSEIDVVHESAAVRWSFHRGEDFHLVFALGQYRETIEACRDAITALDVGISLEPKHVVFPRP